MLRRLITLALVVVAAFLIYTNRHRIAFLAGLDSNKIRIQGEWHEVRSGFKEYDIFSFYDEMVSRNEDPCGNYHFKSHSELIVTIDGQTGEYIVEFTDADTMDWLQETLERGRAFSESMRTRRSVRHFAPDPVPREALELAIAAGHSAPSGANRQPWHFVAVSDSEIKAEIRRAAEAEEREFYEGGRATDEWLDALAPLGTGWRKPFLETAPWLVAVFKEVHGVASDGSKITNYYVNESVGIACGLFIAALHQMGLVTLTHTPQPMRFLGRILARPANERPFILFPVGYPAKDCRVPAISKKPLDEVTTWRTGE